MALVVDPIASIHPESRPELCVHGQVVAPIVVRPGARCWFAILGLTRSAVNSPLNQVEGLHGRSITKKSRALHDAKQVVSWRNELIED